MEQRKLEIYTFFLRERGNQENQIDLNNVYGRDLFEILRDDLVGFIDQFPPDWFGGKTSRIDVDEIGESIFTFSEMNRSLSGKIKIGDDQGKVQDVVTSDENKEILYTIERGQSVERPYFFMMVMPTNNRGFLVLERDGRHAIKGDFCKLLKRFTREKLQNVDLIVENFIEGAIVRDFLLRGDYEKIILTRNILPHDQSERYLGGYDNQGDYQVQLSITPKGSTNFPIFTKYRILQNLESYNGFFESQELREIGFDENANVKVVTTLDGNTRTIDLEDTFKMRPYYVVDVDIDEKGFSNYASIKSEAISLLRSFNLNII